MEVKDLGISSTKIATSAVTADKLAPDINITTTGSISAVSIAGVFYGDASHLTNIPSSSLTLSTGEIFVGNTSNQAQGVVMYGDVTIDATGLTTINDGAITASKITPGAITNEAIKSGSFPNITQVGTLENLEVSGQLKASSEVVFIPSQINVISGSTILSTMLNKAIIKVKSNGGNINVDTIQSGVDGQIIVLTGVDETDTITLVTGGNIKLSGGVNFTLGKHDSITLSFDANETPNPIWFEISRSDN